MLLKYTTIREVQAPERAHPTDAGIDFFMPVFTEEFKKDLLRLEANFNNLSEKEQVGFAEFYSSAELFVPPQSNLLIPSGVKVEIPYGYMGLFLNKSGIASKMNLVIGGQVIDCFFSGEVHIDLHNVGYQSRILFPGQKIAQMVLVPVLLCDLTLVGEDQLYDWMKQEEYRDSGGHGSTG